MENYLYFAEAVVETGDDASSEALMVPASSYVGADPLSTTQTAFYFKDAQGNSDGLHKVVLTHTASKNKEVMKGVMQCIGALPKDGFTVVADMETGTATTKDAIISQALGNLGVSTVAITSDQVGSGSVLGISGGTTLSTSYGAGAISTGSGAIGAPRYSRTTVGDVIVTTSLVDLTGLTVKGGNAGDAIGVGTDPAYIYKNVVNENGIIFKQEIACLELPAAGSGTITTDINLAWNSAATIDYDEAVGTGSEINTAGLVAGQVVSDETAALTANHYAYLTEGDTAASDGTHNAGQILITLYGAKIATA